MMSAMERGKNIDRGYAWLVLVAAFMVMFLGGIMTYSSGVINTALLEEVDSDISKTSWVGSTMLGTYSLTGPFAGFITKVLGYRVSCFSGGVLLMIGLVAASFVNDVTGLILTYGIITGLGLGMCINSSVVVPGHYFKTKQSIAFGIVASGAGFGMFAGGPLVRYLIAEYQLRGCFLILGGVISNMCVAACVLRPISNPRKKDDIAEDKECFALITKPPLVQSLTGEFDFEPQHSTGDIQYAGQTKTDTEVHIYSQVRVVDPDDIHTDSNMHTLTKTYSKMICCRDGTCTGLSRAKKAKNINIYGFICYNASVFFWTLGETACLFHLPNYAETKGSTKTQAANLFTVMGLASILSRILSGFAGNDSTIGPLIMHIGLLGLEGMLTLMFPLFSHTYGQQMGFSAAFGLYSGGPNSLVSPLTIGLVGLNNLPLGIGVQHFSCGIGYFIGPPIASFIYTSTDRYDFTYVFAGAVLLLASLFGLLSGLFASRSQPVHSVDQPLEVEIEPLQH